MNRTWTDEQDEVAYDTFREVAMDRGGPVAVDLMYRIMRMGAAFTEVDIKAWIRRYEEEEDIIPHRPRDLDWEYAKKYRRYMDLRRG